MGKFLIRIFIKNHQDTDDPEVREKYGKLAGIVGIVSNFLLCAAKMVTGFISGSIAIIADGVNNLADASSSVITLVGFRLAAMPEDRRHPYGHARIEYITGLIISIVIIFVGLQLLKGSIDKIRTPEEVSFDMVTIIVLIAAIIVKIWQSVFNSSVGKRINSLALKATATDSINDVVSTTAVLAGVLAARYAGWHIDGYIGCIVALFIMYSGIQLVRETSSPLLGEAPDQDLVNSIVEITRKQEGVLGAHDLMVHNYGPGKIFASIHVEVDAGGDLIKSHDMVDTLEKTIKEALKIEFVVHMDPVRTDDPVLDRLRKAVEDAFAPIEGVESIHDFRIVSGPTHSNVLFDTVLTYRCTMTEEKIKHIAEEAVASAAEKNMTYFLFITFDRAYATYKKEEHEESDPHAHELI